MLIKKTNKGFKFIQSFYDNPIWLSCKLGEEIELELLLSSDTVSKDSIKWAEQINVQLNNGRYGPHTDTKRKDHG